MLYELTARCGAITATETIDATDDGDAIMAGSFAVMRNAATDSTHPAGPTVWARGAITLAAPDGRTVQTMAAKGDPS